MNCLDENLKLTLYLKRYNLLYSKITLPEATAHNIARPDCTRPLATADWKIATLVAPAGFGKSSIARQIITQASAAACWVSIDVDENNPQRFIYYLIAAIKTIDFNFCDDLIDTIRNLSNSLHTFADKFLHEVSDIAEDMIVVFDDYHHLSNPVVHDLVQYLIANAPKNIRFIITSREKLPLKLARMRIENKLVEIEREQLRFSTSEIAELLRFFYKSDIDPRHLDAMASLTEGWPAALQLLCMSSQDVDSLCENLDRESNENFTYGHIKDYIREEVLSTYDNRTIDFVLKISILSSFTPALCDALLGNNNTNILLDQIEAQNSFLIALDRKNKWFRFHHLFNDALTADFEKRYSAAEKSQLHKSASSWYEKNGYLQEAIEHAVQSGDSLFVDGFLDRNAENRILIGQLNQLFEWFQKIERGNIQLPMVNIWIAWVNIFSHRANKDLIENLLNTAVAIYQRDSNNSCNYPAFIAHTTAIRAFIATYQCDFHEGIRLSLQAMDELVVDNQSLRSGIIFNLSRSHFFLGNLDETIRYANQAYQIGFECKNYYCAVAAVNLKAQALMQLMDFDQAEMVYRACLDRISESKLNKHPVCGYIYNGLGEIAYYRNHVEEAKELLLTGMVLCEQGKETRSLLQSYKLICQVYQAEDDLGNIKKFADKLNHILNNISADLSMREIQAFQIDMDMLSNNFSRAQDWAKGLASQTADFFTVTREYEYIVQAKVLSLQNHFDDALVILDSLLGTAQVLRRRLTYVRCSLYKSKILFMKGAREASIELLKTSLSQCHDCGIEIFFQEAKGWLPVNTPEKIFGSEGRAFIAELSVKTLSEKLPADMSANRNNLLTDREWEIMRGVKVGLSNKQISDKFNISEGTVKRHIHNIFNKLNVKNRIEALQYIDAWDRN